MNHFTSFCSGVLPANQDEHNAVGEEDTTAARQGINE